jgi:Mn-dependent DtxR family transcriptional regulator
VETGLGFAKTLTLNRKQRRVDLVEQIYQIGVKLTKQEMEKVENSIERVHELSKWFVSIIGNRS